jgi:hypothetical protein
VQLPANACAAGIERMAKGELGTRLTERAHVRSLDCSRAPNCSAIANGSIQFDWATAMRSLQ